MVNLLFHSPIFVGRKYVKEGNSAFRESNRFPKFHTRIIEGENVHPTLLILHEETDSDCVPKQYEAVGLGN
jgi:hypothetical protein